MSALAFSTRPSERRLAANRANAQLSTGPTAPEGTAKASLNTVKTGLTGRAVLLPSEDAEAYEAHIERFRREFQPVGDRELQLVQSLADTQWRLDRIPNLEAGLFYQQDAKELKELQAQRKKEQEEQAKKATSPKTLTASVGFEFTNGEPTPESSRDCQGADHPTTASALLASANSIES